MSSYDTIRETATKIEQLLHGEVKKNTGTFSSLRASGKATAQQIIDLGVVMEEKLAEYKENLSDARYREKETELRSEFETKRTELVEKYREEIKSHIGNHKEAITKALCTPPTPEQLSLLQSLQIEGKNISESELNAIVPQLMTNYRAIKGLESIAKNAGYRLIELPQFDFDNLQLNLNWAESYLERMCTSLETMDSKGNKDALGRLFFGDYVDHEYQSKAIDIFDSNAQTNEIKGKLIEKRTLTEREQLLLASLFEEISPENLKETVNKYASESPEVKSLIELSPEYSGYLSNTDNITETETITETE